MSAPSPSNSGAKPDSARAPNTGRLLLVPAPLDFGCGQQSALQDAIPAGTLLAASRLQYWICENAKTTRAYLKRVHVFQSLSVELQALQIQELPRAVHKKGDHHGEFDARPLLAPALSGHDIGLVSEAGMPAIADPGSSVVRAAHDLGLTVVPLVGPVSILLGLAASGLNGQNFAFVGYLPQEPIARTRRVRELEVLCLKEGQTQLFIETPYRNVAMMQTLLQTLAPSTRLSVSSGLTLPTAHSFSATVANWRNHGWGPDNSTPAVFAIGR